MSVEESKPDTKGISRRKFLKGAGVTGIGVAVGGSLLGTFGTVSAEDKKILGPDAVPLFIIVNGKRLTTAVEPRETLAEVFRERFHLTGTKISCDRGACGACTVLIEGVPVCSCSTLALDAADKHVETVEGLASKNELSTLQQAFVDHDGLQCGFCTSGMLMSCKALLDRIPHPTAEEVRVAVSGNICRCGTYPKVVEAVMDAAQRMRRKE